jgi:hypothetical protein
MNPGDNPQSAILFEALPVNTPVADVEDGYLFDTDTTVSLSVSTPGAAIRYTTDGSIPSAAHGTVYSGPINISQSTVIKAVAYLQNGEDNSVVSGVMTSVYNARGQVGMPSAIPLSISFTDDTTVVLVPADPGDTIYYTVNGDDPSTEDTVFRAPITMRSTVTLKFFAVNGDGDIGSIRTEVYTLRDTLAVPSASVPGTSFTDSITVVLSHPGDSGVLIRYTVDGSDPDQNSPVFNAANPIFITTTLTLKARVYPPIGSEAYIASPVIEETYIAVSASSVPPELVFPLDTAVMWPADSLAWSPNRDSSLAGDTSYILQISATL